MDTRIPRRWSSPTDRASCEQPVVCIVDPKRADYEPWQELAAAAGIRLEFLSRAGDALRMAQSRAVALWVVNADLPDLVGADLCAMLKSRNAQTPVYLVADTYSADRELAAGAARATLFDCKGAHREWLAEWLAHCKPGTTSRGTAPVLADISSV